MSPKIIEFGQTPAGEAVHQVTISDGVMTAQILTYGATVRDLRMDGIAHPLVLGSSELSPYFNEMTYFGAIVGRYANRIGNASFLIDGKRYEVDRNFLGKHILHGGAIGTGSRVWSVQATTPDSVTLTLALGDGEMGFPGNMSVEVVYSLPGSGALQVDISATTDAPTPCCFAHHGYFNLDGSASILEHQFQIDADNYLPVDEDLIPTGEVRPVDGTAFDFRVSRPIGDAGYDHNFCLSSEKQAIRKVAQVKSSKNGVELVVETNEPGLQVYDGGQMPADGIAGLDGAVYGRNAGLALEAQSWPDAPNQPGFPPAILRPGETYRQTTRYVFSRS